MLLCVPAFHVADELARKRHRPIQIAIRSPKRAEHFLPLWSLVERVGVIDRVPCLVTQIHHDLARIFEIVHLFFQSCQFGIGQIKRYSDHRLTGRTSPFVGEIAKRPELLQAFGFQLAVKLLHKALERRAFELEPQLPEGLAQYLLNFRRRFFKSRHSGLVWRLARRSLARLLVDLQACKHFDSGGLEADSLNGTLSAITSRRRTEGCPSLETRICDGVRL